MAKMEETDMVSNSDNDADTTLVATSNGGGNEKTGKMQTPQLKAEAVNFDTVVKRSKHYPKMDISVFEELEHYKIKFNTAMELIKKIDPFIRHIKRNGLTFTPASTPLDPNTSYLNSGKECNGQLPGNGTSSNGGFYNGLNSDQVDLVVKERDSLRKELKEFEIGYSSLFKRYEKLRDDCALVKNSEEALQIKLEEEKNRYDALLNRFCDLRDGASKELERANEEVERQAKAHDESTLGLRIRLRKLESELQTKEMTLSGKDNQIKELSDLCDELTKKFEAYEGSGSLNNGSLMDF